MAKHAIRQFILARLVLGSAAAVLVALVVWVAVVAGGSGSTGEPLMVQPTADLQAAQGSLPAVAPSTESVPVAPSLDPSAPGSASPSPSASRSPSASAKPKPSKSVSRTPSASPSRSSPSPAPDVFTASYATSATWREGFIAAVSVVNNSATAREWSVTLTYPSSADVEVRGGWNATVSTSGDTITLRGRSLAPGASITAGFQGSKGGSATGKPTSCSVGGGSCRMS
ncbi:cellulose binding domain-containing protein [Actinoplanes sp. CA-252034]|uniref:cellulose binding domain-containing protein n=1 Tax=Actinoplanes sp. CA-252034 TaxID=3239906 RepID=UPI003D9815AF